MKERISEFFTFTVFPGKSGLVFVCFAEQNEQMGVINFLPLYWIIATRGMQSTYTSIATRLFSK